MKKLLTLALAAGCLLSCETKKSIDAEQADENSTATVANSQTPNRLTDQQQDEGWKLLFNGKNMDGWRTFKGRENNSWEVIDGTLHCKPATAADKRSDMITVDQYADFELAFEWKIAPGDNSGVIYRATEAFDRPYLSGPEYQLIDDKGYPDSLTSTQLTGANYDMHAAPDDKKINPPGEWNTSRIVANGNHVEHWLNGVKVVEYEIHSEEWKKLKEKSKWKDADGYGMAEKGHIDLQDHGGEVWFRNIMIKTM